MSVTVMGIVNSAPWQSFAALDTIFRFPVNVTSWPVVFAGTTVPVAPDRLGVNTTFEASHADPASDVIAPFATTLVTVTS